MKKIKLLFMDVDGTLTDGKVYISNSGELFKAFSIKDGYAINEILKRKEITPVIITARTSDIVKIRCGELGINELYQGCSNKKQKMLEICKKYGIGISEGNVLKGTAYIGDDIPDLECMTVSEYKGCPKDAISEIKKISDFISTYNGGDGAVREFIEWLVCDEQVGIQNNYDKGGWQK